MEHDRRLMIAPGARYLITPVSGLEIHKTPEGRIISSPAVNPDLMRSLRHWESQQADKRVEISIDSVIFEDGLLVGPDSADRLTVLNRSILARKGLAAELARLPDSRTLRRRLRELHDKPAPNDPLSVEGYVDFDIKHQVEAMSNKMDAGDEHFVRQHLAEVSKAKFFNNQDGLVWRKQ
jgi:hypothetical protein